MLTQTSLAEAEKKLAAAVASRDELQQQLKEIEAAAGDKATRLNTLMAQSTTLNDEKLGSASQLAALREEVQQLQPLQAAHDEKAAALAAAEARLQEPPAPQRPRPRS